MITKKQIKLIHSLGLRKYRLREKLYVAEGPKLVANCSTPGIVRQRFSLLMTGSLGIVKSLKRMVLLMY